METRVLNGLNEFLATKTVREGLFFDRLWGVESGIVITSGLTRIPIG